MISIKDIAKECGYSSATVSKALNGGTDIGKETGEKIRAIAKRMGYFPNAAARALKTRRTYNLGVIFHQHMASGLTHEYFASLLNSFKVEAERQDYEITFINNCSRTYLDHCRYRQCDGIMLACSNFANPEVLELAQSEIPMVSVDYAFDHRTAILSDNIQDMSNLIRYVHDKGHRKIAFIHGEDTVVTRKRLASFYQTCSALDLHVPTGYVKPAKYHDPPTSTQATRELLNLNDPPTCILYPDDFAYVGGMNEIEHRGLSIPEDISVVGYDGIYLSQVLRPKLTTLYQDSERIGKEAAVELIEAIQNPKIYIPKQIIVKGEILKGESVKQL